MTTLLIVLIVLCALCAVSFCIVFRYSAQLEAEEKKQMREERKR